jgi:hypothetical protein
MHSRTRIRTRARARAHTHTHAKLEVEGGGEDDVAAHHLGRRRELLAQLRVADHLSPARRLLCRLRGMTLAVILAVTLAVTQLNGMTARARATQTRGPAPARTRGDRRLRRSPRRRDAAVRRAAYSSGLPGRLPGRLAGRLAGRRDSVEGGGLRRGRRMLCWHASLGQATCDVGCRQCISCNRG